MSEMYPEKKIILEVIAECARAEEKFGPQLSLPDGTTEDWSEQADVAKRLTDLSARAGKLTWQMILSEEFLEACAEPDAEKLRAELVQVAAVAVRWVAAIDKRLAATKGVTFVCSKCNKAVTLVTVLNRAGTVEYWCDDCAAGR